MMKPIVSITAFDEQDNELTGTIECEVETCAQAIELWQFLRAQANKWLEKHLADIK